MGKALYAALLRVPHYEVVGVTRETYDRDSEGEYDIVINSAMPSGRFWARENPHDDFAETVGKTSAILYNWKSKKFVQISTISARSQRDTIYGRHKAAAEALVEGPQHLIVRLGPMYSDTLEKGVLIDMLQGKKVWAHPESRYCFAPLEFIADWIAKNAVHRTGVVEVGAKNGISLQEIADYLGGHIEFEGAIDHQEVQDPEDDFPDVRDVIRFLDKRREEQKNKQSTP